MGQAILMNAYRCWHYGINSNISLMSAPATQHKASLIRRTLARFNIHLPPSPTSPPAHQPNLSTLLQLASLIGLALVFHFSIADLIIASYALCVFLLKLVLLMGKSKRGAPPQIIIILLTIVSIALIIMLYGGWNGQRAGISFLVLLVSLKFLESRLLRDYYVVCLILYFLAASSFLFNSSITNITIVMVYTLAITVIMLKLSSPNPINWKASFSLSGGIVSKALPLALILFFFFPRIHGSFGFIPGLDDNQFDNELSNSLVAGDMATSAFDNRLAFRVEFDDQPPPNNQLYWRSKVMPIENKFTWSVRQLSINDIKNSRAKKTELESSIDPQSIIRYTILHEPSTDLFLPYLDYVTEFSQGRKLNDYSVWQQRALGSSFSYQGGSVLDSGITESNQIDRQSLLNTVSQPSARTQALLTQWRQQSSDPTQLAQLILKHISNEEFYYSLYPPSLDVEKDPIDEFLFDTKTGYCEHYASVFTTLMRWLGVPARVVAGYQGGLANQSGQYMEIRYSDAHAWSEILVNQQWLRVDPTAAINPDRIEYGMDAFMSVMDSTSSGIYSNGAVSLSDYLNPRGINRYYRMLSDNWKNIGYQWNKWIVNYDADTQKELLTNLGITDKHSYRSLVVIMFASIGVLMLFYFWQLLPKRIKRGEAQQLYLNFVERFEHAGVIKELADTPNEFAQKAGRAFPRQRKQITAITQSYLQLRYGKEKTEINTFKQLVKEFRLKKNLSTKHRAPMQKLHKDLFVAGQIHANDFADFAEAGIKTIINNRPDNEQAGQLTQSQASELAAQHGIAYFYLPMANGQPMPPNLINDFKQILDNTDEPVLAHCRSGMRSSFIWALGQVANGALSVDEVIQAASNANIPLANYRAVLESAAGS